MIIVVQQLDVGEIFMSSLTNRDKWRQLYGPGGAAGPGRRGGPHVARGGIGGNADTLLMTVN